MLKPDVLFLFLFPLFCIQLCAWQEWDADRYFLHQHKSSAGQRAVYYKPLFPSPINVRDALLRYCDLSAPVRKTVLPKLALYVQGSKDAKKKLMYYASSEGRESFTEDIAAPGKNIVDMLEMFPIVLETHPQFVKKFQTCLKCCKMLQNVGCVFQHVRTYLNQIQLV